MPPRKLHGTIGSPMPGGRSVDSSSSGGDGTSRAISFHLSSGPSREVRGAAASAAGLRRVSPAVGLQLVVGVSGLLSPHEGDMAVKKQPQQLSLCWAGAASYFRAADWWSLAWGAEPLSALATVVRGGGDGLGHALAARGVWARCYAAAKEAGTLLAEQLRARACGGRPVTLVGVSLGARVVWQCLEELAALPAGEGHGVVLDVVLVAAPVTVNPARWERVAPAVSGRLVNAYVPSDTQLAELYRMDHPLSKGCCGVAAVPSERVTNYDATPHVAADARAYHFATPAVLESVGIFPDTGSVASD